MTSQRILSLFLIFFSFFLISSCSTLDKLIGENRPSASIVGARLSNLNAQSATVTFDVSVDNPYGVDLPILGLDFALSNRGNQFLAGAVNDPGFIPAMNSRVVPVVAQIPFADAMRVLSDVKPGAVIPYEAIMGLNLDLPSFGAFRIPLQKSGEFPIPAIPNISIENFAWESFGLNGAVANIDFKFGNGNQFPISVDNMGYDFELAGKRVFRGAMGKKLNLAPGEDGAFSLRLELSAASLGFAAFRMLGGEEANYGFIGDAKIGSRFGDISLPVDSRGRTTMKR